MFIFDGHAHTVLRRLIPVDKQYRRISPMQPYSITVLEDYSVVVQLQRQHAVVDVGLVVTIAQRQLQQQWRRRRRRRRRRAAVVFLRRNKAVRCSCSSRLQKLRLAASAGKRSMMTSSYRTGTSGVLEYRLLAVRCVVVRV